jgi:pimeloyl-ACP methyl ester carboxylesterase
MSPKFDSTFNHMYPRLAVTLIALFFTGAVFSQSIFNSGDPVIIYNPSAAYGTPSNPADSALNDNKVKKWIYSPTQKFGSDRLPASWDRSKFKCYKVNNMNFRLRFPNNYDSTNPGKYPVVVFWHGAGEVGVMHENQDQLFWGAQLFEQRINAGEWNGFLLFPQEKTAGFDIGHFTNVNVILDSLINSCALDGDRVIHMGLSFGGDGSVHYAALFPERTASVVVANPKNISTYTNYGVYLHIPFWAAYGGIDTGPSPSEGLQHSYNFNNLGGNIYVDYYSTQGHSSWSNQWAKKDLYGKFVLSGYWNSAHKAQPLVYHNNTKFCNGQPINAKLELTPGYYAYEWQLDNGSGFVTIAGATTNSYTATAIGKYRVHFKRTASSAWSVWTPNPVAITNKACTIDTAYVEHFDNYPIAYYADANFKDFVTSGAKCSNGVAVQNGVFTNATELFSQDAKGSFGGGFMLNATASGSNCTYSTREKVWQTFLPVTVTPNTDYTFSFYLGNQTATTPLAQIIPSIDGADLVPTGVSTTGSGDYSWKKYSYTWNSGSSTSVNLYLFNTNGSATGNDFAIDEISLVKYKTAAAPGGVASNLKLWSNAGNLTTGDNSPVPVWLNNNVNSNSLVQTTSGSQPVFKNNAASNINFNPVVAFNRAVRNNMIVNGGFAGTAVHNAAHVFMVMSNANLTLTTDVFGEPMNASAVQAKVVATGNLSWQGGNTTIINTTAVNELNKAIVWSYNKDNINNTGSGNKMDIRKNGIVTASSNTSGSFTGNNSTLTVGGIAGATNGFTGNIAEVIYYLDANINAGTQNKIESYLAIKYGTTLGYKAAPQNYRASDSTIFWNANTTYQTDVFGIGTDSASGLVQPKSNSVNSGSGDGTGQAGKGNLVLAAKTTMLDKSFLMIGNDSAALTQRVITAAEGPLAIQGAIRVGRTWKVNNTGNVGAVDLSFDSTGLGTLSGGALLSNYALLIDNDGDGNYKTGVLSAFYATSATGKKIMFEGATLPNNAVFTIITVRSPNATLPATWLGFNVVAKNNNALLNWQTSEEINVDHYVIEHSLTGTGYIAVGAKAANNNTGVNSYTFTHGPLTAGIHYYRIRRIDKDGQSEYSVVKTVNITSTAVSMEIRPNPVVGSNLVLAISTQQNTVAAIHIMSVDGKTMLQQNTNLQQGINTINLNVSNMPSGIYLVQLTLNGELVTRKMVRQR